MTMDTEDIIRELRAEGEGERGVFYENYGSGIHATLLPLADLLNAAQDEHPELVARVASSIYRMR